MRQLKTFILLAGLAGSFLGAAAQTSTPAQAGSPSAAPVAKRPVRKASARKRTRAVTTIPLETAPPTPVTAGALNQEQQQRAADQRLLAQQQAQSNQAAQITDQQVRTQEKQQDSIQSEPRIQDAPGPGQTGLVPVSGPPVQPGSADTRIQDAPGPAQTVPQQPPTPTDPSSPRL